jgi:hypothetical protein
VGIKSLRIYPGEISLVPGSFLTFSISWPSWGRRLCCHTLLLPCHHRPISMEQADHVIKFWICEWKEVFPPFKLFYSSIGSQWC